MLGLGLTCVELIGALNHLGPPGCGVGLPNHAKNFTLFQYEWFKKADPGIGGRPSAISAEGSVSREFFLKLHRFFSPHGRSAHAGWRRFVFGASLPFCPGMIAAGRKARPCS